MRDLLFLVHRIPYPPNKGDKIRSFNWLKHLSREYRVHLGCFIDDPDDWRHVDALRALCADVHVVALRPRRSRIRSLSGLLTGKPLTLPYYAHGGLSRWVHGKIGSGEMDAVLVFSGAMAQFLPRQLPPGLRSVCDFVDIDSDKWQQYAGGKPWPMSWLYRREGRRLLAFEREMAWCTDASLFVSAAEADMFKRLAPEVAERTTHVENGVDTDYFSPDRDYPLPYPETGKVVVFTGAMDYWPNEDAACWFAQAVLPLIQRQVADIRFHIVGGRPSPRVRKLAELEGVVVDGAVHDMRPYLAHADVAVAPLRIARGVQNKVLEAMSMGTAVVVTAEGLDGIHARPGRQLALANDAGSFAAAVIKLLDSAASAHMAAEARQLMQQRYAWKHNLQRLQRLLEGETVDIQSGDQRIGELLATDPTVS